MRISLQREYRFEAAHFLPRVPPGHQCSRIHGHSYVVSLVIDGEVDPVCGWVLDFASIDEHVAPLIEQLDHRLLNELPGLENPTSELLAVWLWDWIVVGLPRLVEIHVSETVTARCCYRGG